MYSLGRADYGRLGLGQEAEEKSVPTLVTGIEAAGNVACGGSVSFAVTREGELASKGSNTPFYPSYYSHGFLPSKLVIAICIIKKGQVCNIMPYGYILDCSALLLLAFWNTTPTLSSVCQ